MSRKVLSLLGVPLLALSALGLGSASQASAQSDMSLTIGKPTVTSRLLVDVPVTIVCAPLSDPTISDDVSVSVQQASGRSISTGSASVFAGPYSMNQSNPPFLTCDGTTL